MIVTDLPSGPVHEDTLGIQRTNTATVTSFPQPATKPNSCHAVSMSISNTGARLLIFTVCTGITLPPAEFEVNMMAMPSHAQQVKERVPSMIKRSSLTDFSWIVDM